jgi:hypothetical protein
VERLPSDGWHPGISAPSLVDLMSMDESGWEAFSRGSPCGGQGCSGYGATSRWHSATRPGRQGGLRRLIGAAQADAQARTRRLPAALPRFPRFCVGRDEGLAAGARAFISHTGRGNGGKEAPMFRMRMMPVLAVATLLPLAACADRPEPLAPDADLQPLLSQSGKKVGVGELGGVPYYADLGHNYIPTDGGWVAIVFKRSPDCVPPDFNLLDWLDFSLFAPDGPDCPSTVDGFAIFGDPSDLENGIPPRQEHYTGDAVPVWFAPIGEFNAAIADGVLTIGELERLDGLLRGVATIFNQSINNSASVTGGNGQKPASSSTVAKGTLEDGRSFHHQVAERFIPPDTRIFVTVKITLK